ncbi:MAG: response regulator transcription factor [Methylococcales bacterium]|nr:response regulator transcription factor [Methylococcales bacterium]
MRILIAQNDPTVTEKIKANLIAEDFDVDVAKEGEEALSYAEDGDYGAIILDILLEKKNGFDVCEGIRNKDNGTPIMMLTEKSTHNDEIDSLESGANDFLRIPFSVPVLMARIRVLLRTHYKEKSGNIAFGSFFYNQQNKKFFFDDEEILLTRRESKIFEILMLAKGDVVPKQSLMNHVWGIDFDGDPNIVHVYIGYLRQKISDKQNKQNKQVLQTVRGIGYRLVDEIKE